MNVRIFQLVCLAALALLLAACGPPPDLRDPLLIDDTSLVDGEPCGAPCWRGIIPGETPWNQALTIIEDDPTLEDPQVQEDTESEAIVAAFRRTGGSDCCQLFSENGSLVNLIFIRIAPGLLLPDLIDTYGEPTYVLGSEFSEEQTIVNLVYPQVPMVVYAFVPGVNGALDESSDILGYLYMTESDMELLVDTSSLYPWTGYGAYQTIISGEYAVTPQPTATATPEGFEASPTPDATEQAEATAAP
jgi:hypothetical protein